MRGPSLAPGSLFADRYVIERTAGSGGMGTVYRARDIAAGVQPLPLVALKLLHSASAGSDEAERFTREARLLAELDHPHIVRYLQSGRSRDGVPFLVMEWLDGESLGTRLQRGPLTVPESVTLAIQAAEALAFAHRRGVLHRDLNPANLFLVDDAISRLKILDFGIARRMEAERSLTQTGVILGTPKYLSPEQARGVRQLSPAADLFSIGCVLYECLAGQPPFHADHIAAILARILFDEPKPLGSLRPGLPAALLALVNRLLHKDPEQRLSDAAALADQLRALGTVLDVPLAPATHQRPGASAYFGEQEQRVFSLVLATAPELQSPATSTLPASAETPQDDSRQLLLAALQSLHVTASFLANGCLLATFQASISAQDAVSHAARVALLVQEHWPSAAIAVLTGRGVQQGRAATGEILDRALLSAQELHAQGGGIYVDTLSARLLAGRFVLSQRSDGRVLLQEERDASRPLLGKPTPFVGREGELGTLESLLLGAFDESAARAVLVTGPPGAGKSRLRHELLRRAAALSTPPTQLVGCGDSLHAGTAYRVVAQALLARCQLSGSEPVADKWRRMQQQLGPLLTQHVPATEQARLLPLLAELCGVWLSDAECPALAKLRQQPQKLPDQLRWAALTWLSAECQASPVLLVLDDLQWVDPLSLRLLDEALHSLRHAPLFVLALARPDVHVTYPKLWHGHALREIALRGLGKRACQRLIQQALGRDVSLSTVDWIVEQSAGNALFLEELIRSVAEGKHRGPPETILAMLQARIGHLAQPTRRALLAGAVFGSRFVDRGVATVLGGDIGPSDVVAWLSEAETSELIERQPGRRSDQPQEYAFRHALVQDAAYALLLPADRLTGHQRAAEYLESHPDPAISLALIGYHFRAAELFGRALFYYQQAADRLARMALQDEALRHYQTCVELLPLLPPGAARLRQESDVLVGQVQCSVMKTSPLSNLGRVARARQRLLDLWLSSDNQPEDERRLAVLDYEAGRLHTYQNEFVEATRYLEHVLPRARERGDAELLTKARLLLARIYGLRGLISQAVSMLEQVVQAVPPSVEDDIEWARAYIYLGIFQALAGRAVSGYQYAQKIEHKLLSDPPADYKLVSFLNLGFFYYSAGCYDTAIATLQAMRELANAQTQAGHDPVPQIVCFELLAFCWGEQGSADLALELYKEAAIGRRQFSLHNWQDLLLAHHAQLLLQRGEPQVAIEQAQAALAAGATLAGSFGAPMAQRVWGRALAALGAPAPEVDEHLRESLRIAEQVGNVMEALKTEIAWGQLCLQRNEPGSAQAHFLMAKQLLSDDFLPAARAHLGAQIERGLRACVLQPLPCPAAADAALCG